MEFETIVKELGKYGFHKVEAPWTLNNDKFNIAIDLLLFNEIEEKFTVNFNERHTDLHILGFSEVLSKPETVQIEVIIIHIPSLPGMALLKLMAWSDRPEERDSYLGDFLRIVEHYFSYNPDEIVEYHNDTFPDEGELDKLKITARVLGGFECFGSERILKTINGNTVGHKRFAIAKQ